MVDSEILDCKEEQAPESAENGSEETTFPVTDSCRNSSGSDSDIEILSEESSPNIEISLKKQITALEKENILSFFIDSLLWCPFSCLHTRCADLHKPSAHSELKRRLKFMSYGNYSSDAMLSKAICNVTYQNISVRSRQELEDFISHLQNSPFVLDRNDTWYLPVRTRSASYNYCRRIGYSGSVQYYPYFTLDRSVWPIPSGDAPDARLWSPPYYTRAFEEPLPHQTGSVSHYPTQGACFNCGLRGHQLSSCPSRHDPERIRRTMKEWRLQKETSSEKRYYETPSSMNPIPGRLSEKMKVALGIQNGQDPPYYAKMKIYGYPPAYYEGERNKFSFEIKWEESKNDGNALIQGEEASGGMPQEETKKNEILIEQKKTQFEEEKNHSESTKNDQTDKIWSKSSSISLATLPRKRLFPYPGLHAPDLPKFSESEMPAVFSLLEAYYRYYGSQPQHPSRELCHARSPRRVQYDSEHKSSDFREETDYMRPSERKYSSKRHCPYSSEHSKYDDSAFHRDSRNTRHDYHRRRYS